MEIIREFCDLVDEGPREEMQNMLDDFKFALSQADRSDMEKIHKGYVEIENEDLKKELLKNGKVEIQLDIPPNTYVDLGGVYGRYGNGKLIRVFEREAFGIKPRNREQVFSMDSLLDDEMDLVTLIGVAGTGKTLLALACGLKKVLEERKYERKEWYEG